MFWAKRPLQNHWIFEKRGHFDNPPSCKILTFDQKLKFKKTSQNPFYRSFRVVLRNKPLQKKHKTLILEKWDHFKHRPSCKRYIPCTNLTLGQRFKFLTKCQNVFYKSFVVVLRRKALQTTLTINEFRTFWKSAIMQRLQRMQKPHFGSKIKIPKNKSKSNLQIIYSCFAQKTAPKNTKFWRNETILKIGHHAHSIAHAKSSHLVKN